jgi:RNA polymerase sigma-70 factor (sigma-E family)
MDFEEYVRSRSGSLLRFAYLLSGDQHTAEDLTQSALADALTHWRRVARADHPDRYVQRMLVNRYLQAKRRRAGNEQPADPLAAEEPDQHDEIARVSDRDQVKRLLDTLPPRSRAVLTMRYYLDLDDRAIAEATGMSPATVRSTVSRGLRGLRPEPSPKRKAAPNPLHPTESRPTI